MLVDQGEVQSNMIKLEAIDPSSNLSFVFFCSMNITFELGNAFFGVSGALKSTNFPEKLRGDLPVIGVNLFFFFS